MARPTAITRQLIVGLVLGIPFGCTGFVSADGEPMWTVLVRATGPCNKAKVARALARIEGCRVEPLVEMNADELREYVQDALDGGTRSVRRKFKAATGQTGTEGVTVGALRDFVRQQWGEDIFGVELPMDANDSARALAAYAKSEGLRLWDELVGAPFKAPKAAAKTKTAAKKRPRGVQPATDHLQAQGFGAWFGAERGKFSWGSKRYRPQDMEEIEAYRFPSKGGGGCVVRGLAAPDGTRGVILQPYGEHADPPLLEMLSRVRGVKYID